MNDDTHSPLDSDNRAPLDSDNLDRITQLLADRALFGLDEAEQRELDTLLASAEAEASQPVDLEFLEHGSLERTAASAQLAMLGPVESLPDEVAALLSIQGQQALQGDVQSTIESQANASQSTAQVQPAPSTNRPSAGGLPRRELLAWFATAAAVAFALFSVTGSSQSTAELRAELLAQSNNVTKVAWSAGGDPAGESAAGDVVWHNDRQQGVMRFSNLTANDPAKSQYQLWIFDAEQDDRYPIDGGVFDVPVGAEEVLVKIDAKLPVVKPTLFAITIEKPGGVVVSSRQRLPLLAKVESL